MATISRCLWTAAVTLVVLAALIFANAGWLVAQPYFVATFVLATVGGLVDIMRLATR